MGRYIEKPNKVVRYLVNNQNLDLSIVHNANIVIVGEQHGNLDDMSTVFKIIERMKPDIVLVEALGDYVINSKVKAKELYRLSEESHYYQGLTKLWLEYIISNKQNVIYKGIELITDQDYSKISLKEQFMLREDHWMGIIDKEILTKRVLIIVGDTHLRTIETKELGRASPLYTKFLNRTDAVIIRTQQGEIQ